MRVKEEYPVAYYRGHNARTDGKGKNPPYSPVSQATDYFWWCAGWNDADMVLNKNKKELV